MGTKALCGSSQLLPESSWLSARMSGANDSQGSISVLGCSEQGRQASPHHSGRLSSPAICFMKVMQTPSAPSTPLFTSSLSSHSSWAEAESKVGRVGSPTAALWMQCHPPPPFSPFQVGPRPPPPRLQCPLLTLCQAGSPPHLGATGILQLQVLLHQDLVDLVEDDVHPISAHQGQVPVALQQRKGPVMKNMQWGLVVFYLNLIR